MCTLEKFPRAVTEKRGGGQEASGTRKGGENLRTLALVGGVCPHEPLGEGARAECQ